MRNVGSIARTAECAGVDGLIIPARGSAQINSDAIKTSAGALYKLPVVRAQNIKESIEFLKNSGLTIVAATEKAKKETLEEEELIELTEELAELRGTEAGCRTRRPLGSRVRPEVGRAGACDLRHARGLDQAK